MGEDRYDTILIHRMEEKLMSLMGDAYYDWAAKIAREIFYEAVKDMDNSDFKDYILEHFEEITK